uniref:Uncharacterized protein n=1 Tax=Vombatus ursinus TaxID=29139 RepID=A0A4X2K7R4_VOMUR
MHRAGLGELLDDQHPVVQLLRSFSSDCPGGWPISLDATLAHHLHQCSYHLRLFRNWLRSGQDDPECLYGTLSTQLAALLVAILAEEPAYLPIPFLRLRDGALTSLDGAGARLSGNCSVGCSFFSPPPNPAASYCLLFCLLLTVVAPRTDLQTIVPQAPKSIQHREISFPLLP